MDGLQLWLDATDTSTLFQTSPFEDPAAPGDFVFSWMDKSPNQFEAFVPDDAEPPIYQVDGINGLPAVRFTGETADEMIIGGLELARPYTAFIVNEYWGDARGRTLQNQTAFPAPNTNDWFLGLWNGNFGHFADGWVTSNALTAEVDVPYVVDTVGTEDASFSFVNGLDMTVDSSPIGNPTAGNNFTIAGNGRFREVSDADVSEIIIYDRVLTDSELSSVRGHLYDKYGVTLDVGQAGTTATENLGGVLTDVVREDVGGTQPGLLHQWYGRNNPGSYNAVTAFYDFNAEPRALESPDVTAFNPSNTWWTGNQSPVLNADGDVVAPQYPIEVIDQARPDGGVFNGGNNDNYVTALSGQIRIERNGTYLFTDGVDDLSVLAIDINRDGVFDDFDDEFLINDNAWTTVNRENNNGGFTTNDGNYVEAIFEDIDEADESTQWFDIEIVVGEGGGDDAGIIYWNPAGANDDIFPSPSGADRIIADENLALLTIPEENLRGPGGLNIVSGNLTATLSGEVPYIFEINEDGTVDALAVERSFDAATTVLDLNDAKINLAAIGDVSGLEGTFTLLSADEISGDATVIVPDALQGLIDTSALLTDGTITFGAGSACNPDTGADINGDGSVGFPDFLILSANFGQAGLSGASHELGDVDCSGDVAFADFLALSAAFGSEVGAQAVPEPSGGTLLGLGALLLGLVRRRLK